MEDYIRGVLCGYLQVQIGTRDDAKRRRTFVVLSDSRMDYYLSDPRPTFTAKIDATYFLSTTTRLHYYLELNPRAPPYSICLTTDRGTEVYVADTQEEADLWYRHISERLEALSTMLKGPLMLRKELPANQQVKRFVLRTKYRWKARYVELGRSTLRFCKPSDHKTKTMKQFALTGTSFSGQESTTYLRQLSVFASYSIPVDPSPQTLRSIKNIEKMRRENEDRNGVDTGDTSLKNNEVRPKGSNVAAFYPFIVTTGQAYIILAAPTEQIRTHWILAIRLRIIALKYRHNGGPRKQPGLAGSQEANPHQVQGFIEAQPKPGGPWKQHYVELDNGMLRVKKSERKLGSIFEVQLLPTCRVTPLLDKANAFTVRSLGCEVSFAPGSAAEARRWMDVIRGAAAAVERARYQRIFHGDIQRLLRNSVIYTLDVASEASAGIVLEKHKKRIFALSHEPVVPKSPRRVTMAALVRRVSMLTTATSSGSARTLSPSSGSSSPVESPTPASEINYSSAIIPQGSVLVGISQFGMMHDSVDTIWHTLRQKKGCYKQAKRLIFRAPAVKEGSLKVKFRAADEWVLHRCRMANGMFRVEDAQNHKGDTLVEVALRDCEVELFSDDDCFNGIKLTVATSNALVRSVVFMNVALDDDAFMWFAMLHMEISVAQDSALFPLNPGPMLSTLVGVPPSGTPTAREDKLAADQAKSYRDCTIVGTRVEEIEKYSREQERIFLSSADVTRFFQHLDAVGSGKVSSAGLVFTMKLITKHIRARKKHHGHEAAPESTESGPLDGFFTALETFTSEGRSIVCLTPDEFATVMSKVTHPAVVELVRKESRNNIQCI
ncbi:hypothetical protein PHYSODRAFT_314972 [Phytophthora sojae]|uniref:PH domain-containing protein n=1 Tax=Phytophthora sojae (strain P6497) TaxID=1094619 RepID=G4ZJA1_PHYSP|nr:hypothetical protein PHYSODRAFT_314972 [Phytophthora sojae]EGZ17765.1 hypothetical protein PHYSODRAFT_314972 [Phytophthora sojae]|eukprot:XP_009526823.1 hypothetical protein PHYSODRAFT_314972 [Phytophthora sojae]